MNLRVHITPCRALEENGQQQMCHVLTEQYAIDRVPEGASYLHISEIPSLSTSLVVSGALTAQQVYSVASAPYINMRRLVLQSMSTQV